MIDIDVSADHVSPMTVMSPDIEATVPTTLLQDSLIASNNLKQPIIAVPINLSGLGLSDLDKIRYTWQAVASHNTVLRTAFPRVQDAVSSGNGHMSQIVLRSIAPISIGHLWPFHHPSHHSPAQLVIEVVNGHLDATIHIHRALVDATSIALLRTDFVDFIAGRALPPRQQFAEVLKNAHSRGGDASRAFWKAELGNLVTAPVHCFPLTLPEQCNSISVPVPFETMLEASKLCTALGVSARTIFQAAWASVLSWHSEAGAGLVGFAVAGRDVLDCVGPFDQTYPLQVRMDRTMPVQDWVQILRVWEDEASAHAHIGYDATLEACPEYRPSTLMTFGPHTEETAYGAPYSSFSLVLHCHVGRSMHEALVSLRYSPQTPEAQARTVVEHLLTALENICSKPMQPVGEISIMCAAEKERLLALGEPATQPVEGLVHHLFEQQVKLTPHDAALQFETQQTLTYDQVNKLSNSVARQLPCGRGSFVPVCMPRSINLIVALLAIVKTGAAYVTLDPEVPRQRNQFIYDDVSAPFALVSRDTAGVFACELAVEDLVERASKFEDTNLDVSQTPEDIVYVIYTSGSTGQPKGVLLEHRAAFSGLAAFPQLDALRQLLFHNPVFSAAQRSIWSTLKQGGCLCLASKDNLTLHIGKTITAMAVNVIDVTPSTALLLTPGTVPTLRRMTVAGELINPALVPAWAAELELLNAYGLSENTQFNWRRVLRSGDSPQNIGRPSDTTTAFVLVPGTMALAPLLVPGELCLGGAQLARGYLNRPEKTAQAFAANPFGPGRLYRTGDLAVAHADGSVEMIGRIDFAVKISDQRVDPGEPNSLLQLQPGVRDSAVVAARIGGRSALVAVVVPAEPTAPSGLKTRLAARLRAHLPAYMVPAYWLLRAALPLNINGKVDVPALRRDCEALGRDRLRLRERPGPGARSMSTDEQTLRSIWAAVLDIAPHDIGADDSFLALGGTSLDAIFACARAAQRGLRVEPRSVLQGRSLAQLAAATSALDERQDEPAPFSLAPAGFAPAAGALDDAFPATPLQEGLVADSLLGRADYMFRRAFARGALTAAQLRGALDAVLRANALLRTTFVAHRAALVQVVRSRVQVPWQTLDDVPLAHFLARPPAPVALGEPLLRVTLLREHVVFETHHALFDFWSSTFFYDDLRTALQAGPAAVVAPRPRFSSFVRHLGSLDKDAARAFWRQKLQHASPTWLPCASQRAPVSLEARLPFDLRGAAAASGLTASTLLYTAWALVLSAWTSSPDVSFIVTISGRDAPVRDILAINGPTLMTVPMRVSVDGVASVSAVARQLAASFWDISTHAHFGLRNVLKDSGAPAQLCNTAANFLISPRQERGKTADDSAVLRPVELPARNATDLLSIELQDGDIRRLKLFSRFFFPNAAAMLQDTVHVLRAAVEEPDIPVAQVLRHMGPTALRSDRVIPVDPELLLSWDEYASQAEPALFNQHASASSQKFSSLRVAGDRDAADLLAAWAVLLGRHTNTTRPLFAVEHGAEQSCDGQVAYSLQHLTVDRQGTLRDVTLQASRMKRGPSVDAAELLRKSSMTLDTIVSIRRSQDSVLSQPKTHQRFTHLDIQASSSETVLRLSTCIDEIHAEYVLEQLSGILRAVDEDSDTEIGSLDIIGEKERCRLQELAEFSSPAPRLLHDAFEEMARSTPAKVAVQWDASVPLTYQGLNTRANRFARYMVDIGVSPGHLLPLYMEKSVDTIVSILAVLKTGAAYVPLSPDNPTERNNYILEEIGAKFLVTHTQFSDFASQSGCVPIFTDAARNSLESFAGTDLGVGNPDALAYIIYTSGSTGTPKGVRVAHRAIAAGVQGMARGEGCDASWRVLWFSNYVFDASVHDIFLPLSSGGTLCSADNELLMSDLPGVINRTEARQALLTPTVARLLNPDVVPGLETLLSGGEPLTEDIINAWAQRRTLMNLYGPTEAAVVASSKRFSAGMMPKVLGKPLHTVGAIIVECQSDSLASFGALGELCLVGPQVTQGYINREDLTSRSFVPSPLPGHSLMYRTGDLARWNADGQLECLGRIDHQVKLNGHRIELGEIEQAILRGGAVRDCCVVLLDGASFARPQLAAFCIFEHTDDAHTIQTPDRNREGLKKLKQCLGSLAHYMVPKTVLPLGQFPQTSSGKTDRRRLKQLAEALGSPEALSRYSLEADLAATAATEEVGVVRSEMEIFLQGVWASLLSTKKTLIGPSSSFFALGGDSIAAINLVSICRDHKYILTVGDVLKHVTLSRVAACLKPAEMPTVSAYEDFVAPAVLDEEMAAAGIKQEDVEYIYPCPAGQCEWLTQGAAFTQNWVVTAVRSFPSHHRVEDYLNLLNQLTHTNDVLRTTFTSVAPCGWLGVVFRDIVLDFSFQRCTRDERAHIIDSIAKYRFRFGAPFIRYVLLEYPDGTRDIIIKAHHALWDGTSLRILDKAIISIQETGQPPANTQFKDFALAEWRSNKQVSISFWKRLTASSPPPWPETTRKPVANRVFHRTFANRVGIDTFARTCGVTPAIIFQGVFQLWLSAQTPGRAEAAYDYLLTGRNVDVRDPQTINGACANFLPFCLPVVRGEPLRDFFANTQALFWQATEHGNVGMADIEVAAPNTCLFLFQPFDLPPKSGEADAQRNSMLMRWLVLALSEETRMNQPYALIQEVSKMPPTVDDEAGYKMTFKYDDSVFSTEEIRGFAEWQSDLLERIVMVDAADLSGNIVEDLL
ncbi:NRPS [Neofusicoccum ribis]|uniref:NRPS n=1 Tax=Neofusicoccum ribis TaxID=45134 RepID=A0ABR3SAJ6_9PEZI